MSIFGKFIFIFLVVFIYFIAFVVGRSNSIRALEKIFVLFFSAALLFSIIFSESLWVFLSKTLGVERGTDSILYLFIIVSTSVNLILFRKILQLDEKLTILVQRIALDSIQKKK